MNRWYERAMEELDDQLEQGLISDKDYRDAVRDLNDELRSIAEEEAIEAYNRVIDRDWETK